MSGVKSSGANVSRCSTSSANANTHRAQAGSRAAQPVSVANAPLTPTSTVGASCVDGVSSVGLRRFPTTRIAEKGPRSPPLLQRLWRVCKTHGRARRGPTSALQMLSSLARCQTRVKISPDGKRRRVQRYEALGEVTRKQASDTLAQRMAAGDNGSHAPRSREAFRTLAAEWQAHVLPMYKHSTQKTDRHILERHLLPRFGDKAMTEITRREVQAYVTRLVSNGYAPRTTDTWSVNPFRRTTVRICSRLFGVFLLSARTARPWASSARRTEKAAEPKRQSAVAGQVSPRLDTDA